jgi:hypothetical protein
MKRLATIVLALATALTSFSPSFAENSSDPHSAQSRGSFGDSGANNNRYDGCNVYRCGGRYRYGDNGYRNSNRYYRDGYNDRGYYRHNDNGAAAIIGGLAVGAIIGGIIASQPRARSYGSSHVDWCYSRYRSYRASDNTYQPNYGSRRQCVSRW